MSATSRFDDAATPRRRSLRERRRDYTRKEIAAVAIELFDEHGFDDVTVDVIAEAAGVSSRTFFRYFATKEDVVMHEHERVHRRLVREFEGRPAEEGPIVALRNAYLESSVVTDETRRRTLVYGRVQLQTPSLNARLIGFQTLDCQTMTQLLADRMGIDPDRDPRPEAVAIAMFSVATAMFRRWVAAGGDGSPSELIGEALDLLVDGLGVLDIDQ